jgi:hypothetical protein
LFAQEYRYLQGEVWHTQVAAAEEGEPTKVDQAAAVKVSEAVEALVDVEERT